jgi:molecular chaperone GrpE
MTRDESKNWNKFKEEHMEEDNELVEGAEEDNEEETEPQETLGYPSHLKLEEELTLAEQRAHENWEKSVRALAELENVRRRAEREVANAHRYGLEKIINALLPVLDSLEQALQLADKEANAAMHEGLELTMKLFLDVLQKFDVKPIDPVGMPFDPQLHEAMSIQEIPGTAPNTVVTVFQKGYILNDRLIRPARVIVSKS